MDIEQLLTHRTWGGENVWEAGLGCSGVKGDFDLKSEPYSRTPGLVKDTSMRLETTLQSAIKSKLHMSGNV